MIAQCKIHCYQCDNDYYVYKASAQKDNVANCPHCGAIMNKTMWEMVISAIYVVDEVNCTFRKYHSDRGENLFSINVENILIPND